MGYSGRDLVSRVLPKGKKKPTVDWDLSQSYSSPLEDRETFPPHSGTRDQPPKQTQRRRHLAIKP